ncbi:MAG: T9SS type A sorting domain-containing protein [Bacteroidia bacterium]|nr:T9SS type A sorting domain-containing protein [Bacteroidia bacterium]
MANKTKSVFYVSIYPNPTKNKITLLVEESAINENKHYQINIYDIQGKLMQGYTTNSINSYEIDIQSLPVGIYNVNISTGHWTKIIKFIKE